MNGSPSLSPDSDPNPDAESGLDQRLMAADPLAATGPDAPPSWARLAPRLGQRPLSPAPPLAARTGALAAVFVAIALVIATLASSTTTARPPVLELGSLAGSAARLDAAAELARPSQDTSQRTYVLAPSVHAPADPRPAWRVGPDSLDPSVTRLGQRLGIRLYPTPSGWESQPLPDAQSRSRLSRPLTAGPRGPGPAPDDVAPDDVAPDDTAGYDPQSSSTDRQPPAATVAADGSWWVSSASMPASTTVESCTLASPASAMETSSPTQAPEFGDAPDCPQQLALTPAPGPAAVRQARALLDDLLEGATLGRPDTAPGYASATVSFPLLLDGLPTGLDTGAAFDADGQLVSAHGYLGRLGQVGPYPLVGDDEALIRLTSTTSATRFLGPPVTGSVDPSGELALPSGGAGQGEVGQAGEGGAVAVEVTPPVPSEIAPRVVDPSVAEVPPPCVATPPEPTIPEPTIPEPVTVEVTAVEAVWSWTIDRHGDAWLLPAYRFLSPDGPVGTVIAVADEYLETDPRQPLIPASDGRDGQDGPADGRDGRDAPRVDDRANPPTSPQDVPSAKTPTWTDSDPQCRPEPSDPDPLPPEMSPDPALSALVPTLVGLSLDQATGLVQEAGGTVRVVQRDGTGLPVTMEWSPNRVNLSISQGKVTDATVG